MKARVRTTFDRLKPSEQDKINEFIKSTGKQILDKEYHGIIRRVYKIVAICLNQKYGFGEKRLSALFDKVGEMSKERDDDPIFWYHVDKCVIKDLKLEFEKEDYDRLDY